uniref:Reverse transcriptase domain-containing protein n=2 Tax=Nicotiana TaxID=4085 RepID=A0A1S3ZR74_TOBAC|nr:PREDICTED: uncharacterized protein LOC104213256 [Nicotiana sylvestris]XP_016466758.1 PREDICTED: uncharacterized protein LOC107789460 [Nicotiana tabacum]
MKLTNVDSQKSFIVTLVHAKCDSIERIELWDSLHALAGNMTLPWIVEGDFNVIWDEEEKFGGRPVSLNELNDFRYCINNYNLFDLGFKGSIYTWWNALSKALNALHMNLYFCGFGLPKWSPKINHLLYADDTIILSSSDANTLLLVMEVLAAYEKASGQLINKNKSAIYMHHSTSSIVWDEEKLREILPEELINHILEYVKLPVLPNMLDKPYWMLETGGNLA